MTIVIRSGRWPDPHQPRRLLRPAELADRPRAAARPLPAAGAGARAVAGRSGAISRRPRTTPRGSRSPTRSAPGSTSSPTARCVARATRTASPPRSRASTSTTRAPRSTAAAIPTRCRAWSARSPGATRCRCATSSSCARTPAGTTKITVPGPFTMSQQAQDDYYGSPDKLGMAYADAVRGEILDLFEAGADVVQVDEPYMQARPEPAREYGLDVLRARHRRHRRDDRGPHLLRLRGDHPRAAERLLVPARAGRAPSATRSASRPRSRASTLDVLDALPEKTIILGVLDLVHRRRRDAGDGRRRGSAARSRTPAPSG